MIHATSSESHCHCRPCAPANRCPLITGAGRVVGWLVGQLVAVEFRGYEAQLRCNRSLKVLHTEFSWLVDGHVMSCHVQFSTLLMIV